MGKRLIIKGADFSANRIDFGPVPQEVEWSIGTISSTGVIGAENTGIHSNLLELREVIISIAATILDSSAFDSQYGIVSAIALYDSTGTFITRVVGLTSLTTSTVTASKLNYPNATKARFVIGGYRGDVTNVDIALSKVDYTLEGI